MNLNQLKVFYYAAKNSNLSVAAQELFITQPAVTKGIQRLQEHYEIRFVDFVGKKLVLTDAGEPRKASAIFNKGKEGISESYRARVSVITTFRRSSFPLTKRIRSSGFR
jgi:hypothetical protein